MWLSVRGDPPAPPQDWLSTIKRVVDKRASTVVVPPEAALTAQQARPSLLAPRKSSAAPPGPPLVRQHVNVAIGIGEDDQPGLAQPGEPPVAEGREGEASGEGARHPAASALRRETAPEPAEPGDGPGHAEAGPPARAAEPPHRAPVPASAGVPSAAAVRASVSPAAVPEETMGAAEPAAGPGRPVAPPLELSADQFVSLLETGAVRPAACVCACVC